MDRCGLICRTILERPDVTQRELARCLEDGQTVVVCPGGEDPAVQLRLVEAVADLTGLGTDRITICKGR